VLAARYMTSPYVATMRALAGRLELYAPHAHVGVSRIATQDVDVCLAHGLPVARALPHPVEHIPQTLRWRVLLVRPTFHRACRVDMDWRTLLGVKERAEWQKAWARTVYLRTKSVLVGTRRRRPRTRPSRTSTGTGGVSSKR
jgi:hypothetical protein